ncbi:hypothetical protein C2E25_02520 [Geothermobacter hydrogeniphilus]|uniref:C-type lysozyme inhibitor domain-containing protein n=1 Tax=Geothermobacter hydrogeniphilus TaxID=1969733 RepID=A0A2K2HDT8_9BACT|nr:MliC family protein [Geothermobacter hydrogeniphilus]PNU21446.1 hypothetical protein C2E25_02520 [Geothermobacter hydrogeniphilus]
MLKTLTVLALLLTACSAAPSRSSSGPGQVLVYECGNGVEFVADIRPRQTWLFLPGQTVALPLVHSADSGNRYGNGNIRFWNKGDTALLDIPDGTTYDCSVNRARSIWEDAKLRGVDFRATGNEPGWFLEIDQEQIVLVSNYGRDRFTFPSPPPQTDRQARQTRYVTSTPDHRLNILLEGVACRDDMSGEAFETRVELELDGRKLRGCGRAQH